MTPLTSGVKENHLEIVRKSARLEVLKKTAAQQNGASTHVDQPTSCGLPVKFKELSRILNKLPLTASLKGVLPLMTNSWFKESTHM